jgi:hypothetical protein
MLSERIPSMGTLYHSNNGSAPARTFASYRPAPKQQGYEGKESQLERLIYYYFSSKDVSLYIL